MSNVVARVQCYSMIILLVRNFANKDTPSSDSIVVQSKIPDTHHV